MSYLLINTSASNCDFILYDFATNKQICRQWEAGRNLARDMLGFVESFLAENGQKFVDLKGLGVFEGPGSFTGLRIGMTVMNTLADALDIPIVGARGDDWSTAAIDKLKAGTNQKIVLPFYGGEANITLPKK